jgi:hypothetical protein
MEVRNSVQTLVKFNKRGGWWLPLNDILCVVPIDLLILEDLFEEKCVLLGFICTSLIFHFFSEFIVVLEIVMICLLGYRQTSDFLNDWSLFRYSFKTIWPDGEESTQLQVYNHWKNLNLLWKLLMYWTKKPCFRHFKIITTAIKWMMQKFQNTLSKVFLHEETEFRHIRDVRGHFTFIKNDFGTLSFKSIRTHFPYFQTPSKEI